MTKARKAPVAPLVRARHLALPSGVLTGPSPAKDGTLVFLAPSQSGRAPHRVVVWPETLEATCGCEFYAFAFGGDSRSLVEPMRLCPHLREWRESLLNRTREHRGELPGLEEM